MFLFLFLFLFVLFVLFVCLFVCLFICLFVCFWLKALDLEIVFNLSNRFIRVYSFGKRPTSFYALFKNISFRYLNWVTLGDLKPKRENLKAKSVFDRNWLTGGNWQKWKRVFLTCPCHEIYRDEAVGLKSCKNTWKITIFVKMWNLG